MPGSSAKVIAMLRDPSILLCRRSQFISDFGCQMRGGTHASMRPPSDYPRFHLLQPGDVHLEPQAMVAALADPLRPVPNSGGYQGCRFGRKIYDHLLDPSPAKHAETRFEVFGRTN